MSWDGTLRIRASRLPRARVSDCGPSCLGDEEEGPSVEMGLLLAGVTLGAGVLALWPRRSRGPRTRPVAGPASRWQEMFSCPRPCPPVWLLLVNHPGLKAGACESSIG